MAWAAAFPEIPVTVCNMAVDLSNDAGTRRMVANRAGQETSTEPAAAPVERVRQAAKRSLRMSPKTTVTVGVALALVLAAAAPAAAQTGPRGPHFLFEEMDLNNDGEVSLDEMRNHRGARFDQADADNDGSLSRDEMIAAGQARVAAGVDRMLDRLDTDEDGAISRAEMDAAADRRAERFQTRMFERLDRDGNGAISAEEFEDAADVMRGHRGGGYGFGRDRG
jgi:Ca2+-binding EF-hand superfamily protein